MAKSSFADVNISLKDMAENRESVRKFTEDPRRRKVSANDPDAPRRFPWKVKQLTDSDRQPRWTVERQEDGSNHFTENFPDPNTAIYDHPNRPKQKSIFRLRMVKGIGLSVGCTAEPGDTVTCFGVTALEIARNAEVLEEIRPS